MLIVCGSRDAGLTDRIHVSRRIAPAGRAGMATAALRHDPAHPRHLLRGAPAREYRRYQHQAAGRRGRRTRQDRRSLMWADSMSVNCPLKHLENVAAGGSLDLADRKSTRLNSSHGYISYAV